MGELVEIKRIAILSVHASPLAPLGDKKTGGLNVYVRDLAQELGRRGIFIDIFTRRFGPDLPEIDLSPGNNVRVIYVTAGAPQPLDPNDVYPYVSQFAAGVIAFATKQGVGYDLVYSHYWLSGWVANKLKEVWNTPFVQMFHTLGHMKNRVSVGLPPTPDVRTAIETQIVQWADRIIAATPAEVAQLRWLYRADRRKIDVIPPGVDAEKFRPVSQSDAKRQLGMDESQHLLLFVGRIEPLKAVDTILQAIDLIRRECPHLLNHVRVAVIGGNLENADDIELTRLRSLATELQVDQVVEFLGARDHTLLPTYYAAATAVLVPSDYESFGMVALEAMASGTPVIASEVGGLAFLVRDKETGFLIPVRDPKALARGIKLILADPDKRNMLGKNAAELAQQYTWTSIADRLLPIFSDVANKRRAAPAIPRRR